MSVSRKKNQKSTPTRGATALNSTFTRKSQSNSSDSSGENSDSGSSTFVRSTTSGGRPDQNSDSGSTFVRPTTSGGKQEETKTESRPTGRIDHPTTKYDYIEQMEQAENQEQERPTGRIDHPTTKYDYIEQMEQGENQQEQERPTGRIDHPTTKYDYTEQMEQDEKQQGQERPSGRIDHPTGKYQYLEDDEKVPGTKAADNSDVVIEYTLKVVSPGPNAEEVADLVLGSSWRSRNVNPNGIYSCTLGQTKANEAFERARQVVALGAKVEFKKRILIEVTII